jgi:hypothetical protein
MKQPPTDEHSTHEPHDAPAEPEVQRLLRERRRLRAKLDKTERELTDRLCSGDVLTLPVEEGLELADALQDRAYETTGDLLRMSAAKATEHAHRNPDDADAQGTAAIVKAIEVAHEAGDLEFIKKLAAKADHYLRYDFVRRPQTRAEEADMLCSTIATGLRLHREEGWTMRQVAELFVTALSVAPIMAKDTCVPITGSGPWRGTQAEAEVIAKVERAIELAWTDDPPDPEKLTRAALKRLGYKKTDDLFKHRRRRHCRS